MLMMTDAFFGYGFHGG